MIYDNNGKRARLKEGDVVLFKGEEKNRGKWKIGVVSKLIPGRDGIVRAVRLGAVRSYHERPIQFLYPMELHCGPTPGSVNQREELWSKRTLRNSRCESLKTTAINNMRYIVALYRY